MSKGLAKIWILFITFLIIFIINLGMRTGIGSTALMWLILDSCIFVLSLVVICKIGLPFRKQILISFILGFLMIVAYRGISITSVKTLLVTTLTSLSLFSISNRYEDNRIKILKSTTMKALFISVFVGLIVGVVLGYINLQLNEGTKNFNPDLSYFITALSPAIYEEIALRAFPYALCLYFLEGRINTKTEEFTCYFMMITPHGMIHTPDQFIRYGFVSGIISLILLALLFGLPFALLQRKRDIVSAMVAHGVVDVIRFCFLGLPY